MTDVQDEEAVAGLGARIDLPTQLDASRVAEWGSDSVAEALRATGIRYIALNPGASYRGLHDSIVNHLSNVAPSMLLCLHEEHAVAIAHGYAKAAGEPMGVALHSNVGLMHASMALFNAFCDRVPMLVVGAVGPLDAERRRPWIDWIHTSVDQAALVRSSLKWDDQPGSAAAAVTSILAAARATRTYPSAPTYVVLDSALQEARLEEQPRIPDILRSAPPMPPVPNPDAVVATARLLRKSTRTVLLLGRVGRGETAWDERIQLADRLGALVLTDLKAPAAFPLPHLRHPAVAGSLLTDSGVELLASASAIVSLDWIDLAGTLQQAFGSAEVNVPVVQCTMDHTLHQGFSKEHFGLAGVDIDIAAHPDAFVHELLGRIDLMGDEWVVPGEVSPLPTPRPVMSEMGDGISVRQLAATLSVALEGGPYCLARVPLSWHGADLTVDHPLGFLGYDGGGGIGSGPGMAVGAALALAEDDRLAVAVLGDGDTLMGATALWTAAHHRLPMLIVVANNRSFGNDEIHQERVARQRGRPVNNRWIGQHIRDPDPNLAQLARSLGLTAHGPIVDPRELRGVLTDAVAQAREGAAVLVDVHTPLETYRVTPVVP